MDREEGRIRLASSSFGDGMAQGVNRGVSRDGGNLFHREFAWWGSADGHQIEAAFFWAENRGGWDPMWVQPDSLFKEFEVLEAPWIEAGATQGPTIETIVGEIETFAFEIDSDVDTFGDDVRQCLGFTQGWDRRFVGSWSHYPKILHFYACGNGGRTMSEKAFVRILSGLSIEGEFEVLVEE